MKQIMLDRQSGRGRVTHVGTGNGQLILSGSSSAVHRIVISVVSDSGNSVSYTWAIDSVALQGPAIATKDDAPVALTGGDGIEVQFDSGLFVAQDSYSFEVWPVSLPVLAWQRGSVPRSLLESEADPLSELSSLVAMIAAGGLVETASGDWLTLLAKQVYGLDRNPATATIGVIRLSNSGSSAKSFGAGTLWVSDPYGHRYTNLADGTLPSGPSSIDVLFQAENPGQAYNVAHSTITQMVTPLPAVTCTNPVDWLVSSSAVPGSDAENDPLLRQRCRDRWSSIGVGATAATYRFWARTASPVVKTVAVIRDLVNTAQVDVYIAGASGSALSPTIVATVDAYIRARMPLTSGLLVASATAHPFTVSGTVWVSSSKAATAQAAIAAALQAYINNAPIGGYTGSTANIISMEKIIGLIAGQDGVVDATITSPLADITLAPTEVPQPTYLLSYLQVP